MERVPVGVRVQVVVSVPMVVSIPVVVSASYVKSAPMVDNVPIVVCVPWWRLLDNYTFFITELSDKALSQGTLFMSKILILVSSVCQIISLISFHVCKN